MRPRLHIPGLRGGQSVKTSTGYSLHSLAVQKSVHPAA